jgi:hypothetical protein
MSLAQHGLENLRLEIEIPTAGLPNLVQNPSGDIGSPYGWVTPVANTVMTATPGTPGTLEFKTNATQAAHVTTEFLPVAAGKFVAAQFVPVLFTASHNVKVRFEWYTAARTLISSSTQSAAISTTGSAVYVNPVAAPATTAYVKLRFDFYNGVGNPSAAAVFQWRRAMVTWANTSAEVQSAARKNLIRNPSFETNTTTWEVHSGGVMARVVSNPFSGTASLRVTADTPAPSYVRLGYAAGAFPEIPVTGGKSYACSLRTKAATTARQIRFKLIWRDSFSGQIGSGVWSTPTVNTVGAYAVHSIVATAPSNAVALEFWIEILTPAAGEIHYLDGLMVEEATTVGSYFDGATVAAGFTHAWLGTAHASHSTSTPTSWGFTEPNDWRDILGPTHEISIGRAGLDVGLLSATVLDPLLDPVVEAQVRPGKRVRVRGYDSIGAKWETIYIGEMTTAAVTYVPETRVALTASDATADLASQAETRTVATIPALAYLLEGKGVPWLVNGSGAQIASASIVGDNPNATILDQVAITRDSDLGHAYVSRDGVLTVYDTASPTLIGALTDNPADLTTTRRSYVGLDLAFSTDDCINAVTVKWLRWKASKNETTEIVYGPYRDETSIASWGVHAAEFTVAGASESAPAIAAYAQSILTANAVPVIGPRSLTFNANDAGTIALALTAELTHKIAVTHEGVTYTPRIASISHSITPDKWLVSLAFEEATSVAAPTVAPSPPPPLTGSNAPRAGAKVVTVTAVNTDFSATVTFDPPFLTAPAIALGYSSSNPANISVSHTLVATTGFTIWVRRSSGTTDVTVHWIALPQD